MRKRKWLAGLLIGAMALGTITGCGSKAPAESENDTTAVIDIQTGEESGAISGNDSTSSDAVDAPIKIVTTIFPEYQAAVDAGSKDTILFGDRFPFRYMVDDYGLEYFAAFAGCSAESEASFDTVVFLAEKVDELELPAILTIEGGDNEIAETVKKNTKSGNQKILTLNSLQSTTSKDIEEGTTYLSVMKSNLEVLKEALQ